MGNKKKWIIWTTVIVIVTNMVTFLGANIVSMNLPNGKVLVSRDQYNFIQRFSKLLTEREKLYTYYDGPIDDNTLYNGALEGALKGMASSLNDPYTVYMNKDEWSDFSSSTEGVYAGVGLQVEAKGDKIVVVAPLDGSPAKQAGIISGDTIEKVNGTSVSGKELDKAVKMMRGEPGTEVNVTISREGKGLIDINNLKRAKIKNINIKGEIVNNNIGYIQIGMFDENTSKEFNAKMQELKDKNMQGLILDLRGNPGGLLTESVNLASDFIEKGKTIVSTIDKNNSSDVLKSKGGSYIGFPLVVLTDGGSASASEIFSGAIRDYKVGTLVGEKTFGKGVVQVPLTEKKDGWLGDGTALKITIAKYYTPSGENIHGTGIKPDVEVVYPQDLKEKPYDRSTDPQFNKALEIIKGKIK